MTDARPHIAPEGKIWVCMSCLRSAKDRNGLVYEDDTGKDLFCYDDAVLCDEGQPAPGFYAVASRD